MSVHQREPGVTYRRSWTDDFVLPAGGRRFTVKRACNGCGRLIGDVSQEEIASAIAGLPAPDARIECPHCTPEPGARPGAVEGNESSGVVVVAQADEDHAAPGGAPVDTLTVGQLLEALDGLPADMPLRLEVLGDIIDTDGVVIDHHEVRIVGAEVSE